MKLEMTPKLMTSLKLAPQLIQSLKMLQMPVLKLEQVLRHELSTNPMLEEEELLTQEAPEDEAAPERELDNPDEILDPRLSKIDWDYYLGDEQDEYTINRMKEDEEHWQPDTPALAASLYDHLLEQLSLLKLSSEEYNLGEFIIGNINEAGLLTCSVEEMAEILNIDPAKVAEVLARIQQFDPPGVGARDVKEALLLQLRERGLQNSLAARIIENHFHELDRKSPLQLSKSLNVPLERINDAMTLIRTLSPLPATGRFAEPAGIVVPDMIVEKVDGEYVVYHNDSSVPRLRINSSYKELLGRGKNTASDTRKYIREKLEQARWLLNAVNQRRATMVNVMKAIIDEQKEFFERGPEHLRPMIMEDIARHVGMNVATISRVSNGKYVQTPHGVYEIKYFFNSGLKRDDGEELTKTKVKERISELIRHEDRSNPLSDQEIHKTLNSEGIQIARRTVTKYREEQQIQPARFRKLISKESG